MTQRDKNQVAQNLRHWACAPRLPALITFNLKAAFPHLAQGRLSAVLRAIDLPERLRDLVAGVYYHAAAFFYRDASLCILLVVLSVVLQGWPLAGSVFVIALDPWLRYAQTLLAHHTVKHMYSQSKQVSNRGRARLDSREEKETSAAIFR